MNLWDRIFKRSSDPINHQQWLRSFMGLSPAGSNYSSSVSIQSSLTLSAVWAAIKIKAETIASLQFTIYERKRDGSVVEAFDHDLWPLLNNAPSPRYNSFTWRETMQASVDLQGNGYTEIVRDNGRIVELIYHAADTVTVLLPDSKGKIKYKIGDRVLEYDDMLHIPSMAVFNGIVGLSPILQNGKSISMSLSALHMGGAFYENGGHVSGILTPAAGIPLTPEQRENIRKEWTDRYSGVLNIGKTALLYGGMTYTPISTNPVDADLIKSLKYGVEDIARIYRIPVHMMASLERSTFSNIEHQGIEFEVHCARPMVKRWEHECNRKFFLTPQNYKKYFVRYNIDSRLRADTAARTAHMVAMANIGVYSINELRAFENFNPIPGGDKHYRPLNMADINEPIIDPNEQLKD